LGNAEEELASEFPALSSESKAPDRNKGSNSASTPSSERLAPAKLGNFALETSFRFLTFGRAISSHTGKV